MTDQITGTEPDDGDAPASDDALPDPTGEAVSTEPPVATLGSRRERRRARRRNRISKWDRPPDPHDWRFFVGGFGKVLIATGILLFGFVAYQLWGTGIETARAQAKLESAFQERIATAVTDDEPAVGFENWVVPSPSDTTETLDTDAGTSDGLDDPADSDTATEVDTGPVDLDELAVSQIVPGGLDLSEFAIEQDVPVVPGDSFARLDIPKIGVSEYIVPGVKLTDLKRGPGHFPDTPLPGQLGNASLAGHRTTYGAPFFDLDQLAPGDEMEVTMVTGDRFVYRVTELRVVTAADYWVVTTRDPNVAELTLTTCDPKYTARNRLVVHSVLVPEKSAQVGVAQFYQVDETDDAADEPIPGDDPTFDVPEDDEPAVALPGEAPGDEPADESADEPAPDDQGSEAAPVAAPADESASPPPDDEAPAETVVAEDTDHAQTADELDEIDAFSEGWFDDWDAWPQIALWGFALIIISLLAYRVSRRTRHDSIGLLVGIAPFLFCLYFFFQNVNRLLPPGL